MLAVLFANRPVPLLIKFLIPIACGFALSFILQGKGWNYQTLPLTTVNSLIAVLLLYHSNKKPVLLSIIFGAQFLFVLQPVFMAYYKSISCYMRENCEYPPLIRIA